MSNALLPQSDSVNKTQEFLELIQSFLELPVPMKLDSIVPRIQPQSDSVELHAATLGNKLMVLEI